MEIKIKNVEFIAGAQTLKELPETDAPEVAFLGRSNVGKSSLINRLTERRKLARTSSTPGRTTELNYFKANLNITESEANTVDGTQSETSSEQTRRLYLVDLPGFGYAKFSKAQRTSLSKLTVDFISKRKQLAAICLLNDCRRMPEEDELVIQQLAFENDIRLLVVLTKIDKLNQSEKSRQPKLIAEKYHLSANDLVLTGEKTPINILWKRLMCVL